MSTRSDLWSGRAGFILANVAAAVGLGSIWKFPYEVGSNGGGAFIICYLVGLAFIVLPLMLAELAIGRRGRSDAIGSVSAVAGEAGTSRAWSLLALLGIVTGSLILSFYSVIGGWAIAYVVDVIVAGLPAGTSDATKARFDALLGSPWRLLFYHSLFMGLTAVVVARGIAHGIESASKVCMPLLVVLLALLGVYAAVEGDFAAALKFMFAVDMSSITPAVALDAVGLGFFSIGVGLATMITYAAYAPRDVDLREVAIVTIVADTAISFLAGAAVFPIVFAENLHPASGPGLVFVTLPVAFARMPFGMLSAISFFLLLVLAALGSAMSLLELATAPVRNATGWSRPVAALLCAAAVWAAGVATVLSFNVLATWFPLAAVPGFASATLFDVIDYATSNILLPVCGFGIAVFVGWMVPERMLADELRLGARMRRALLVLLKYVVPTAIAAVTLAPFM